MKDGDQVVTSYRDHGHMLACGIWNRRVSWRNSPAGRAATPRARAAPCTCSRREKQFFGGHGIVGSAGADWCRSGVVPTSTRSNGMVSAVTYFGEGAANQGQVYETFNMASPCGSCQ